MEINSVNHEVGSTTKLGCLNVLQSNATTMCKLETKSFISEYEKFLYQTKRTKSRYRKKKCLVTTDKNLSTNKEQESSLSSTAGCDIVDPKKLKFRDCNLIENSDPLASIECTNLNKTLKVHVERISAKEINDALSRPELENVTPKSLTLDLQDNSSDVHVSECNILERVQKEYRIKPSYVLLERLPLEYTTNYNKKYNQTSSTCVENIHTDLESSLENKFNEPFQTSNNLKVDSFNYDCTTDKGNTTEPKYTNSSKKIILESSNSNCKDIVKKCTLLRQKKITSKKLAQQKLRGKSSHITSERGTVENLYKKSYKFIRKKFQQIKDTEDSVISTKYFRRNLLKQELRLRNNKQKHKKRAALLAIRKTQCREKRKTAAQLCENSVNATKNEYLIDNNVSSDVENRLETSSFKIPTTKRKYVRKKSLQNILEERNSQYSLLHNPPNRTQIESCSQPHQYDVNNYKLPKMSTNTKRNCARKDYLQNIFQESNFYDGFLNCKVKCSQIETCSQKSRPDFEKSLSENFNDITPMQSYVFNEFHVPIRQKRNDLSKSNQQLQRHFVTLNPTKNSLHRIEAVNSYYQYELVEDYQYTCFRAPKKKSKRVKKDFNYFQPPSLAALCIQSFFGCKILYQDCV